jgi:hypothetical protein
MQKKDEIRQDDSQHYTEHNAAGMPVQPLKWYNWLPQCNWPLFMT